MKPLLLVYPKCSTCKNAINHLKKMEVDFEIRDIIINNPSIEELSHWVEKSGLPVKKFFNTSGNLYKQLGIKDILPGLTDIKCIELLSSDGWLIKRPLLILSDSVVVGYNQENYESLFS